jgi:hypothetical protein
MRFVIVLTPDPQVSPGPSVIGPFGHLEHAEGHMRDNVSVPLGWAAQVVALRDPVFELRKEGQ